jgi:predicted CXXCH cytochrome family protein
MNTLARLALFILLAVMPARAIAQPPKDKAALAVKENHCATCHGNSDVMPEVQQGRYYVSEKHLAGDIHWQKGLRCYDCHGGDPTTTNKSKAHFPDAPYREIKEIGPRDIPEFCGRCHSDVQYMRHYQPSPRTDQLSEYWTSSHGKQLKATGDPQVAVCTSCHGGKHKLIAVRNLESPVYITRIAKTCAGCHSDAKIMAGRQYHGRPLGHNQYDEWQQGVHGKALAKGDLSAPACNRCHGNHGAVPPDVDSVANVCGSCHGKVAKLFASTRMKHQFEEAGLPGCATCHGNHLIRTPTDEMLGMGEKAVCAKCHAQGQHGATLAGAAVARSLRAQLDELNQLIAEANANVAQAERLGMDVSSPRFDLRKALNARVNARTLIHSFAPGPVEKALAEGIQTASAVKERAEAALEEHTARRTWLAVSLAPIAVVVLFLLFYIRRLGMPTA